MPTQGEYVLLSANWAGARTDQVRDKLEKVGIDSSERHFLILTVISAPAPCASSLLRAGIKAGKDGSGGMDFAKANDLRQNLTQPAGRPGRAGIEHLLHVDAQMDCSFAERPQSQPALGAPHGCALMTLRRPSPSSLASLTSS